MLIIITSLILDFLLSSVMIGTFAFSLFGERLRNVNYIKGILGLFIIVALINVIFLPMLIELNLYVKIGNSSIADIFGIQEKLISINDLTWVGWFEIVSWIIQAIIAYFSGHYLYDQIRNRALTSGLS